MIEDVNNALLNNAPLAIVVVNAEGKIETINAQAEKMFDYDVGALLNQDIEMLLPEGLRARHAQHRQKFATQPFDRPMGIGLDLVGRRKDGSEFPVEVGLSHNQSNGTVKVTCFISDISLRKQRDEQRRNSDQVKQTRMDNELKLAHTVQTSFLPRKIPAIPGWSLAVKWLPAGELAGDFYQYIARPKGELDLVIADVVDKGLPAALFMAFAHPILREVLSNDTAPAEGVRQANQRLCRESSMGLFASLFLARIFPNSGKVVYVNAGHNPPLFYHARGRKFSKLEATGMVLGIEPIASYQQSELMLEGNDVLVFYTDGVTEAVNTQMEAFGVENLEKVVTEHHGDPPQEIVDHIGKAVRDFIEPNFPMDDITIMAIKRG